MLSDEEWKAIEILTNKRPSEQMLISGKMCVNVLINLIEKQSKEIEELNKENTRQHELIGNIHKKWEDKIKAKIEEVDYKMIAHQDVREAVKQVLKSLLEKE